MFEYHCQVRPLSITWPYWQHYEFRNKNGLKRGLFFFHVLIVHFDNYQFFFHQLMHNLIVLKAILNFRQIWREKLLIVNWFNFGHAATCCYSSGYILNVYHIIAGWFSVSCSREIWFLDLSCVWSHLLWSSCRVTYGRWLWGWRSLVSDA